MGELSEFRKKGCLDTYKSNGLLREHFPVKLENGATVHVVNGVCGACGAVIDPKMVRGRVSRPIGSVAVIEAAGYCEPCSYMTELYVRLRATGESYQAEAIGRDGRWRKVMPPPPTLWNRLRQRLMQRSAR